MLRSFPAFGLFSLVLLVQVFSRKDCMKDFPTVGLNGQRSAISMTFDATLVPVILVICKCLQ